MIWVFVVVVAVLVIAAFLALLAGRVPYDRMSEPVHTTPVLEFPEDAGPEDIAAVRFDTALRGYRMDQVDDALKVLQKRLTVLEAELARRDLAE
ncbi:MAG TPA: DivIVA domain-containing protein [Intrasporangiaceae bacterium]|nr:DivIVA domain-containing protein [Intrasporangiaceae bacterium]